MLVIRTCLLMRVLGPIYSVMEPLMCCFYWIHACTCLCCNLIVHYTLLAWSLSQPCTILHQAFCILSSCCVCPQNILVRRWANSYRLLFRVSHCFSITSSFPLHQCPHIIGTPLCAPLHSSPFSCFCTSGSCPVNLRVAPPSLPSSLTHYCVQVCFYFTLH